MRLVHSNSCLYYIGIGFYTRMKCKCGTQFILFVYSLVCDFEIVIFFSFFVVLWLCINSRYFTTNNRKTQFFTFLSQSQILFSFLSSQVSHWSQALNGLAANSSSGRKSLFCTPIPLSRFLYNHSSLGGAIPLLFTNSYVLLSTIKSQKNGYDFHKPHPKQLRKNMDWKISSPKSQPDFTGSAWYTTHIDQLHVKRHKLKRG